MCLEKVVDGLPAKHRAARPCFVLAAEVVGQEINLGGDDVCPASNELIPVSRFPLLAAWNRPGSRALLLFHSSEVILLRCFSEAGNYVGE